jgi:hypothetical protein
MTQRSTSRGPLEKRPIDPSRVRRIADGFSWIDRRFVREFAPALSRDEVLLYFFLVAVADRDGLSYYGDETTSGLLKLERGVLLAARDGLQRAGLVLYRAPLYQVVALPDRRLDEPRGGAASFGEILRAIAGTKSGEGR